MSGIPENITIESLDGITTADIHPNFQWLTSQSGISYFKIYLGDSALTMSEFREVPGDIYEYDMSIGEEALVEPRTGLHTTAELKTIYWQIYAYDINDNIIGQSPVANFELHRSYVGWNTLNENVYTHPSGGVNPIYLIEEEVDPAAYGAIQDGISITNGCITGSVGFVDIGDLSSGFSRIHDYKFEFSEKIIVNEFDIQMLDWGDYLPYGSNSDGYYSITAYAFDRSGNEVDSDTIGFTVNGVDGGLFRDTVEFGPLSFAGDGCLANPGEPGNYTFNLSATDIGSVELRFKDQQSIDPNFGFGIATLYSEPRVTSTLPETGQSYNNFTFGVFFIILMLIGLFFLLQILNYKDLFKKFY